MFIRNKEGYKVVEKKVNGRVAWSISVNKAEKIIDTFLNLTKAEKCAFLEKYQKNDAQKCPINNENTSDNDNIPPN